MANMLYALSVHRAWAGMTQVELAEASGVQQNTISRLEKLRQPAQPGTTRKLANALDTTPKELMDRETLKQVAG